MDNQADIRTSKLSGNGLFAKKYIDAGQSIITIKRPLVALLDSQQLEDTCSNCFRRNSAGDNDEVIKVSACTGCQIVRYCGKSCQGKSWKHHHKHECKVLANIKNSPAEQWPNAVRAIIQLLAMKAGGSMTDKQWDEVMKLDSHLEDRKIAGGPNWETMEVLGSGACAYTEKVFPNTFDAELGKALFARITVNSLTLVTPTFDPLGMVLDPHIAMVNHSCEPNAVVVNDGPIVTLRSLKAISSNEEIFISYIDNTEPYSRRQKELKDRYFFTCTCVKCSKGHDTTSDEWAGPFDKISQEMKDFADSQGQTNPALLDPSNSVGDDDDAKRLQILQTLAYEKLDTARKPGNPSLTASELEEGFKICHDTNIWPLHRQPYPALRHELMVSLLEKGDYLAAALHGIKTYFLIDPILYRQENHPVRIIHKWTLSMSFLFLLSGPEYEDALSKMDKQGVNAVAITWALLREVNKGVNFSHGESSSFAKKVWEKMAEVGNGLGGGDLRQLTRLETEAAQQWQSFKEMASWTEL